MQSNIIGENIARTYDGILNRARDRRLKDETAKPLPTKFWLDENIGYLEKYVRWLIDGGACEQSTKTIYLPMAGHVLGLNIKPYRDIAPEQDLQKALDYVRAKGAGKDWIKACQYGLKKFENFMKIERGEKVSTNQIEQECTGNTKDLPSWLLKELKKFHEYQSHNWRNSRIKQNSNSFWSVHSRIWIFLLKQRRIHDLAHMRREDVMEYISARLTKGKKSSTVNTELRCFHSFLKFLQGEGFQFSQELMNIPYPKQPDSLPKYLPEQQIDLMQTYLESKVNNAKLTNHRRDALLTRAIFQLLWNCGLRTCEVEELRMEDISLEQNRLIIHDSKGRRDRTVYMTDKTINSLISYLAVRGKDHNGFVFLYRNSRLKRGFILDRIKNTGKKIGIKIYPHMLRHTYATQLLNAGCKVTSIQRLLGHTKLETTMRYARVFDSEVADDFYKAMNLIDERKPHEPCVDKHMEMQFTPT